MPSLALDGTKESFADVEKGLQPFKKFLTFVMVGERNTTSSIQNALWSLFMKGRQPARFRLAWMMQSWIIIGFVSGTKTVSRPENCSSGLAWRSTENSA